MIGGRKSIAALKGLRKNILSYLQSERNLKQRIINEVKDMAKIKIEASEYERLLAVEKEYLQLLSTKREDEISIHSAVESEEAAPAPEMSMEPALGNVSEPSPEAEAAHAIVSSDAVLLEETLFRATDAYLLLSRLTVLCKIKTAEKDQTKRDNTAYFLDGDNSGSSIKFTANEFQANTNLKMAAKEVIWRETENCRLISNVRESVLECLTQPEQLVMKLASAIREQACVPLFAVIHDESHCPRLHILWLNRSEDEHLGIAGVLSAIK